MEALRRKKKRANQVPKKLLLLHSLNFPRLKYCLSWPALHYRQKAAATHLYYLMLGSQSCCRCTKTECVWEAYQQWPIKDQFVFKKPTQNENTCLVSIGNVTKGLFQYCQLKWILQDSQCSDSYNSFCFLIFTTFWWDQEKFCFYDFQVFELSWLRGKFLKKCPEFYPAGSKLSQVKDKASQLKFQKNFRAIFQ